ncbi:signal peptidase I [Thermincola ferriacetica]
MAKLRKFMKWIWNIIIGLLLMSMAVLVFFSLGAKISPEGLPGIGSYKMMVVLSGSMSPAFEAGDVIVVSGAKKKDAYQKGDVITFKDPEDDKRIVTHRVVEVIREGKQVSYRTKGDANDAADQKPVPAANVIGQQKWHIPYFGRVVEFAKTRQGLVWMIIVPGIVIILSELRSIGKAITDEIERKRREVVAQPWAGEPKE